MELKEKQNIIIKMIILSGLCVSVLSLLEPHISWISSFCGLFGGGCKETVLFTFLKVPVAFWGILFYITLLLASFLHRPSVFWLTVSGAGVECGLIKSMLVHDFFCILCVTHLIVIVLLFIMIIKKSHIWQTLTLICFFFILTDTFIHKNGSGPGSQNKNLDANPVLASVGDSKIYDTDVEKLIAGQLNKLEKKIYQIKRKNLDKLIEKTILEKEAKKQNISTAELVKNILSSVKRVSNEEIEAHYNQHKEYYDRQKQSIEQTRANIKTYLQENRLSQQVNSYVSPLKSKYNVQDFLYPPQMPVTEINTKNNYFSGPDEANVMIIMFSDYLCPSCQRAHKNVKTIMEEYKGKIKWVFKDYPLKRHKGAKRLAAAARCAGEQGKFWEFQDLLFNSKQKPDNSKLFSFAKQLDLNTHQFFLSLNNNKYMRLIEKDIQDAMASGINSTPTFIINGKVHSGSPTLTEFRKMIDNELE